MFPSRWPVVFLPEKKLHHKKLKVFTKLNRRFCSQPGYFLTVIGSSQLIWTSDLVQPMRVERIPLVRKIPPSDLRLYTTITNGKNVSGTLAEKTNGN